MDFTQLELNELKITLVNSVSACMIQEPRFDNDKDGKAEKLLALIKQVAQYDPEFILKVAIFVRDDLNIRSTANFLLAVSCSIESCTPYLKKYFKATIRLPSDWLDVASLFQKLPETHLSGRALPTCLRKAMVHKFPDFDAYQLGKYNKAGKAKRQAKKAQKEKTEKSKQMVNPPRKGLTIKQVIRQLHISEPAEHVMCILGKKYPLTEEEFRRSHLPGLFDPERVGKRMKLPVPETWETLVSAKGNKAATWEELIDHKKLPFMAMLRNLRNLILTGISPSHHRWVLNKLTNEISVASSRQFPFRFFSAYEAVKIDLDQLKKDIEEAKKPAPKGVARGGRGGRGGRGAARGAARGAGRGTRDAGRGGRGGIAARGRGRGRGGKQAPTPDGKGAPYKKKVIIPAIMPTKELIQQYRDALDVSVKYATIHNVKPIRGSTAVFCCLSERMSTACKTATGMGSIRKQSEIGVLLGLMCKYMCEECDFCVYSTPSETHPEGFLSVQLEPGTILANMANVLQRGSDLGQGEEFPFLYFEKLISERKKIDNFVILSDHTLIGSEFSSSRYSSISDILDKYRKEVNPNLLYVSVNLSGNTGVTSPVDLTSEESLVRNPNDVTISGFSDAILKYIAERGDGNQLQYIQHIDIAKGLNFPDLGNSKLRLKIQKPTERSKATKYWSFLNVVQQCPFEGCDVSLPQEEIQKHKSTCDYRSVDCPNAPDGCREKIPANQIERHQTRCLFAKLHQAQGGKWRTCRVFVSSTFLDMHGERDYLSKYVFPELRERCKKRRVNFFDVDLRWGITQEEAEDEKILNICLSEIDRCRPFFIGLLGERYGFIPKSYKVPTNEPQFRWLQDFAPGRSVTEIEMRHAVLNDPSLSMGHFYFRQPDFIQDIPTEYRSLFQSLPQDREKLGNLQRDIQSVAQYRTYSCKWGGAKDGKPVTTDLHDFGRKVLTDLWNSICKVFPEQGEQRTSLEIERDFHASYLENRSRTFVGRKKILADLIKWADNDRPSPPMVIYGKSGDGKSALLAHFARHYSSIRPGVFVLPHFVGCSPRSRDIRFSLRRICEELAFKCNSKEPIPDEFQGLRQLFPSLLEQSSLSCRVLLLIDGVNQFENLNAFGVDWIQSVGSATKILLSTYEDHPSHKALSLKYPETTTRLESMSMEERRDLVRTGLWEYRKKLDETPSNNQMRSLLRKPEATKPLYLVMACHELRYFGEFEKVNDFIKNLGATVPKIFDNILARIESDLNRDLVITTLNCICLSRTGLLEQEVLDILPGSMHISPLQKSERFVFDTPLPKTRWAPIFNSIELFLRPLDDCNGVLEFFHAQMHQAVHKRYLTLRDKETRVHKLLASFFMYKLDPEQTCSWSGFAYSRSVSELVFHSLCGKVFSFVKSLLSSLSFLEIKCRQGFTYELINELAESIRIFKEKNDHEEVHTLQDLHHFISSNSHILSKESHLLFQQALNEPDRSRVSKMAQQLKVRPPRAHWIEWLNKPQTLDPCVLTLTGSTSPFTSSCFSPDSKYLCCGGSDGTLKVFDTETGAEFLTLSGHTNTVAFCSYSPDGRSILSASYDNTLKIWDAQVGVVIKTLTGHTNRVSCCCWTHTGERVISASWDCSVKFWDVYSGKEEFSFSGHTKPIQCLSVSPDDSFLVSASWDGMMKVWNLKTKKSHVTIMGHEKSIRSVEFSPSGRQIVSTSVDCSVKLWGLDGKEVNKLEGHTKPVNTCSFSPDGRLLISASEDKTIKVWDALGGRQKEVIRFPDPSQESPINCCTVSSDGQTVYTGHGDCLVRRWDIISGDQKITYSGHKRVVTSVVLVENPSGIRVLVSGSADGLLAFHQENTGRDLALVQAHKDNISSIALANDGRVITASDDFTLRIWNSKTFKEVEVLRGHVGPVTCCAFHPSSRLIASGSRDKTIRIWDLRADVSNFDENYDTKGKYCQKVLTGHMDWLNAVSFSSNASLLVSGSWDFNIKIWNLANCQDIFTLKGHLSAISRCLFTSDDEKIVSASYDGTLKIWDAKKGVEIVALLGHTQRVNDFSFLQDTKVVCSVSDDATIRLWDVLAGSVITNLEGHSGSISSCSFSSSQVSPKIISTSEDCTIKVWDPSKAEKLAGHLDTITAVDIRGNQIVSASRDCSLCLWQITQETVHPEKESKNESSFVRTNLKKTGVFLGHSRAVNDCCFDQKGQSVLSCSDDGKLILRDLAGKILFSIVAHESSVSTCAISPDTSYVLSGSWDHTVKVWDSQSQRLRFECDGFSDWVTCSSFNPDGRKILSGSYDKTLRIWDQRTQGSVGVLVGTNSWVQSCSWQTENLILSSDYNGEVRVWDTRAMTCLQVVKHHEKRVNEALFLSAQLDTVITVSEDSTLRCLSLNGSDRSEESSKFFLKGLGTALCCSPFSEPSRNMVAGDSLGNLYLLNGL